MMRRGAVRRARMCTNASVSKARMICVAGRKAGFPFLVGMMWSGPSGPYAQLARIIGTFDVWPANGEDRDYFKADRVKVY